MTEAEWNASEDPAAMLAFLQTCERFPGPLPPSARKLRLWACACCRAVWGGTPCERCKEKGTYRVCDADDLPLVTMVCLNCNGTGRTGGLTDPRSRRAVEVAGAFAEGWATEEERSFAELDDSPITLERAALSVNAALAAERVVAFINRDSDRPIQATLLRSIVGNPFRRPTFGWRIVRASSDMSTAALESGASEEAVWFGDWMINANVLSLAAAIAGGDQCPECKGSGKWMDHAIYPFKGQCTACHGFGRTPFDPDPMRFRLLWDALEETGCREESVRRALRGQVPCQRCIGHPFERGYIEMYGMFHEPGDAPSDIICPDCSGSGWRKSPVGFVRGHWVIDLLHSRE